MNNLLTAILPTRALGIEIAEWSGDQAVLTAPLGPSLNDKGTAFAGSIDSILDLAGWSAIMLSLRDAGIEADVMIVKSETEYTAAVRGDMAAMAKIAPEEMERLLRELAETGRSRLSLQCQLTSANRECALMTAQYAIIKRESND